jgi:glyoxylase-like metal-dependent hydrolase (beta-lactamase superfamily II)
MKKIYLILLVAILAQSLSVLAAIPTKIEQYDITAEKITDQVYVLTVAWSKTSFFNSAIIVGDKGVLLITAQMSPVAPSLEAKIKELTGKPVTHVFNMATDTFHFHANQYFKARGAELIAHKALKYTQASTEILFDDNFSMSFGDEVLTARHTLAHNNAQTIVYLENSNVMLLGDAFRTNKLVYTGYHGVQGHLDGFNQAYDMANDKTLIVSGNKDLRLFSQREELKLAGETLSNFARLVGKKHSAGMSVADMTADQELLKAVAIYPIYRDRPELIKYNIIQLVELEFRPAYFLDNKDLQAYEGQYQANDGNLLKVSVNNGLLFVMQEGKFNFALNPLSLEKFELKGRTDSSHMLFHFSPDGQVTGISSKMPKDSYYKKLIPSEIHQKVH